MAFVPSSRSPTTRPAPRRGRPATTLTLEPLEDRCLLSFGTGGYVRGEGTPFNDVVVQPDEKIVVAGSGKGGVYSTPSLVARYTASGALDGTFGNGGVVKGTFKGSFEEVLVQQDGKIVAVGGSDGNFALARYHSNGSLDNTFGNKGKVTTDFLGFQDGANGAFLQADGKIVAVGSAKDSSGLHRHAMARYNVNGTLDTTFGTGGKMVTPILGGNGHESARAVLVQADGKIVVAGSMVPLGRGDLWAVVRYNANGTRDTSFGTDGIVDPRIGSTANDVAIQPDGKLLVTGQGSTVVPVIRLNPDGTFDTSFDGDGKLFIDGPDPSDVYGVSVLVQPDDKIVVVSASLFRLNPDGSLDATFDGDGVATVSAPGGHNAAALQSDGKILTTGAEGNGLQPGNDGILMRYNADGSLDDGAALLAAGGAASSSTGAPPLTDAELRPLLREAFARWQAAGADTSVLAGLTVQITDLGGAYLGLASGNTILIDDDAAGWGWFVDATPWDDSEFLTPGDQGEQNRMDLLTVLMHEIGHVLGLDHDDEGVMHATLTPGARSSPWGSSQDAVFTQAVDLLAWLDWEEGRKRRSW